jgi:hypothetical protein
MKGALLSICFPLAVIFCAFLAFTVAH